MSILTDGELAIFKCSRTAPGRPQKLVTVVTRAETIHLALKHGPQFVWTDNMYEDATKEPTTYILLLAEEVDAKIFLDQSIKDKSIRKFGLHVFIDLIRQLSSPRIDFNTSSKLLRRLYTKTTDEQTWRKLDASTASCLNTLTICPAGRLPTGTVPFLIESIFHDETDLNRPYGYKHRDNLSPLSAAIFANSEPTFRLFLKRGANIHGPSLTYLPRKALQIPIFAAVSKMAIEDHGQAMMKLCLDNHANINHRIAVMARFENHSNNYMRYLYISKPRNMPGKNKYSGVYYTYTTPLHVFLESIESFNSSNLPDPVTGLTWLLENGASPPTDNPSELNPQLAAWRHKEYQYDENGWLGGYGSWRTKARDPYYRECSEVPTAIEILLDKWGLKKFSEPKFADIIRLLIHQGFARGHVARLLLKYNSLHYSIPASSAARKQERVRNGRATLLNMLVESIETSGRSNSSSPADNPDDIDNLDNIITTFIISNTQHLGLPPGEFFYLVIEQLVKAGANINSPIPLRGMHPYGVTALHRICVNVNLWKLSNSDEKLLLATSTLPKLVTHGADPTIPGGVDGKTAIEALVANFDNFQSDIAKEYLKDLASLLMKLHEERLDG